MKKMLVMIMALVIAFSGNAFSQVLADFEVNDGGFSHGWGDFITSVSQMTDPSGVSTGVLGVSLDADATAESKGAIQAVNIDAGTGKLITFYLWLPSGTPDSILVKAWAQDNSWTWADYKFYTVDIPKESWYPLHFDLEAMKALKGGAFDTAEGPLQKMGLEFGTWDVTGADTAWTGTVYVDNVSLVGAEPVLLSDFEVNDGGFSHGWGDFITSVSQMADPSSVSAGVLGVNLDADATTESKGAIQKTNIEAGTAHMSTFYLWLTTDVPDSILIKAWAQDNSWTWADYKFYSADIPREVWYPLHFDFEAMKVLKSGAFDIAEGPLQKIGLEFGTWDLTGADTAWTGTIYVDNASLLGTETGKKWVMADFENEAGGTQGFSNNGWGPALTNVVWAADPTSTTAGVMKTDWDFNLGTKGSLEHGNINLVWTGEDSVVTDTGATEIAVDVWLPLDVPQTSSQLSIFYRDHDTWTWNEDKFSISDSTVKPGEWNTISFDVKSKVIGETINPLAGGSLGFQLYYSAAQTWTGSIYFDNLTLIGAEEPEGETVSPTVTAEIDTSENTVPVYYDVELTWEDSGPGTETYHVYMSESPITDVTAQGVIRLTDNVPHGEERWPHRPWSNDGSEKSYYYAVTAVKDDGTETDLNGNNTVGPVTLPTSVTAKAKFDADFSTKFTLDGLGTEFAEYEAYKLQPENAGGVESDGWTATSTDMSWNCTFVVDRDYLYISADVTDNDLNAVGNEPLYSGTQPWMGDALELFMGFYDVNTLDDYHNYKDVNLAGTGDWRIAYTAWGTTGTATNNNTTFPGVETTVYAKFTGDGYIIEARIALDSLAMNNDVKVLNGTLFPMSINGNDLDPNPPSTDSSRTLQANWGGGGGHESWKRPGSWGFLEVVDGPTAIDNDLSEKMTYKLYNNYPNPFNPSTTIKFQVAKRANVNIVIYDILGTKVRTLLDSKKPAGEHEVVWDGKNNSGKPVTSGIYFYTLKSKNFTKTQKMMLIK